jgi:hypothetical protein
MRTVEARWSGWAIVILGLGFLRACSLETQPPQPGPCTADPTACDDGDRCTSDTCADDGYCDHAPAALAPDDGNPCTEDSCAGGAEQHVPTKDGTPCGLGSQLQCAGGQCACKSSDQCGTNTPCVTFGCESDACVSNHLPAGTVVDGAAPGDCKQNVCDADGNVVDAADVADVPADPPNGDCKIKGCSPDGQIIDVDSPTDLPPDDDNPCTTEGCDGGTPFSQAVEDGTVCGAGGRCSPAGNGFEGTPPDECQGGVCTAQPSTSCGLFVCDGATDACLLACQTSSQCVAGAYCSAGNCTPQVGLGSACSNGGDCNSTFCVDGVCCNTSCNGTCQQCDSAAALGVCVGVPSGSDPDAECAGALVCDGAGQCAKPLGDTCASDL